MVALLLSKTYHNKQQRTPLSFFFGCSECSVGEGLKGSGLQAQPTFRFTPLCEKKPEKSGLDMNVQAM